MQVTDYQEGRNAEGVKRDNWDKRHPIFFHLLPFAEGGIFSKQLVIMVIESTNIYILITILTYYYNIIIK